MTEQSRNIKYRYKLSKFITQIRSIIIHYVNFEYSDTALVYVYAHCKLTSTQAKNNVHQWISTQTAKNCPLAVYHLSMISRKLFKWLGLSI